MSELGNVTGGGGETTEPALKTGADNVTAAENTTTTTTKTGDTAPTAWDTWRTEFAGEDKTLLGELSRHKTPGDFAKSYLNQKQALSKRAEAPKLPENATPQQITEFRKTMGVPEVAADAKPADFAKAYGIAPPKDYQVSKVEEAMLGDFAQAMHGKHVPAAMVKEAADFFFKSQAANGQAMNTLDQQRGTEWQKGLKDKLGKDYDPMVAAGRAWLDEKFADNPDAAKELLHARLPGGGMLGDHPAFMEMVMDAALAHGFGDRIEASEMEGGGAGSLAAQREAIEKLYHTDRVKYDLPETAKKLERIITLQLNRGEIDDQGQTIKKKRG